MSNCQTYFFQLLARREYSATELQKKGQDKGFSAAEIAAAIDYLQAINAQSDIRVAEGVILGYQGKYGKPKIKQKCREKGISDDLFAETWDNLSDQLEAEDLPHLKNKVMRKYNLDQFSNLDAKTKRKVCNFLQYRGFNPFQVLKQWENCEY